MTFVCSVVEDGARAWALRETLAGAVGGLCGIGPKRGRRNRATMFVGRGCQELKI
ncbi:hypothetical protein MPNT_220013 [Candidatus Methylacidithermus pantelleriae]|uniref:Uncharacterized protein n=1 Tax=Candidatus Methylacidithermus pantelleriae TaxID=2744239 RepID=A0A8J2BJJ4_9BACT|nr:hypothetical protein MPNT_220013 [Candidatus Methylacidithermus pantelleriae]